MTEPQSVTDYTYTQLVNNYGGEARDTDCESLLTHLAAVFPDIDQQRRIEILKTDKRFEITMGTIGGGQAIQKVSGISLAPGVWRKPLPGALDLDHIFMYHAPVGDDQGRYIRLREAAKKYAQVIVAETPECADQSAAIRHVRESVMTANAAIALKGRLHVPREDKPAS